MLIMKFRKGMKTRGVRIALMVVGLSIVFGGVGFSRFLTQFLNTSIDGAAQVNGNVIPVNLFNQAVYQEEQKLNALRQRYGANTDLYMKMMGISNDPKSAALKSVILNELIHQCADACSLYLADQYVQQQISNPRFVIDHIGHLLPASVFSEDGTINVYALTQFMASSEMRGVKAELAEKLRTEFLLQVLQSAFYIPDFVLQDMYVSRYVPKKFSVVRFDKNHFLKKVQEAGVSKEELRVFYEQKSAVDKMYWIPERRSGTVWEFEPSKYGITVSDDEAREFYIKNKTVRYVESPAQFKVREIVFNKAAQMGFEALKKHAEDVRVKLEKNPDDFEKLVKDYSQDGESVARRGIVDYFVRGTKDKEYERAAVKLKNNGDISPLIKTEKGFTIIQRLDRKEASYKSFESVRKNIITLLTEQKFKKVFARDAEKFTRDNDIKTFETFVEKHYGFSQTVGPIEKKSDEQWQRIFSIRAEAGMTAFVQDGKGYILKLEKKEARHLPPFSKMIDYVRSDYENETAEKMLLQVLEQAQKAASSDQKFATIPGAHVHETGFIDPLEMEKIKQLIDKDGYPDSFILMTKIGQSTFALNEEGGILIRLDELNKEKIGGFNEEKIDVKGLVFQGMQRLFTSACIASLFRTATIKINEELIHGNNSL